MVEVRGDFKTVKALRDELTKLVESGKGEYRVELENKNDYQNYPIDAVWVSTETDMIQID